MTLRSLWLALIGASFFVGIPIGVLGQAQPLIPENQLPSTSQIREVGQSLSARQRSQNASEIERAGGPPPKAPGPVQGVTDQNCLTLNQINLIGVTLLEQSTTDKIIKPFEGKCVGLKSIDTMMRTLTQVYFDQGYVAARVYLPPQDISDGSLDLKVEEGLVEGLAYNGDLETRRVALRTLFAGVVGKPANLRDVEQGIEFINRLPSSQAKVSYVAGSKPGYTIINLTDAPKRPLRFSVALNNEGSEATGEYSTTYTLGWDNPLGLYDKLTLSYGFTSDQGLMYQDTLKRSETYSLSYSIPFGQGMYRFSASHYNYQMTVLPTFGVPFNSSGETKRYSLDYERTMFRDQTQIAKLLFGVSKSETENFQNFLGLEPVRLAASSRTQVAMSLGVSYSKKLTKGNISVTLKHERAIFPGAASRYDAYSFGDSESRYRKYNLNIGWTRPITWGSEYAFYSGSLVAQHSDDNLLGAQGFGIGGRYSVRGVRKSIGNGTRGFYIQNDITLPLSQYAFAKGSKLLSGLSLFAGLDYGRIGPNYNFQEASATGMALGVKGQWENLDFEISAERLLRVHDRLGVASALNEEPESVYDTRVFFKLTAKF